LTTELYKNVTPPPEAGQQGTEEQSTTEQQAEPEQQADEKIAEVMKISHSSHIKNGHEVILRRIKDK